MILAVARHWTGLDTAGIWAEVAAVLALVVLVPYARDRARKPRRPAAEPITGVTIQPRAIPEEKELP